MKLVTVDVRYMVFPIIGGSESPDGFRHTGIYGTGFFITRRGLALTAAHVVAGLPSGVDVRVALPTLDGPMKAYELTWRVVIPNTDIAVMRVNIETNGCFATHFEVPVMGQDVETSAIPASMLVRDETGRTKISLRVSKGYLTHGNNEIVYASFALPKGMSGAPMIVTDADRQFVAGVLVGQSRGEEIEDQIVEVKDGQTTHTERIARVEYFARGDLLAPHRDFRAPEFDGLTLQALISKEVQD